MTKHIVLGMAMLVTVSASVGAQYQDWQYSGSLYLLTTPESANMPGSALETNFPVLGPCQRDE